MAHSFFGGVHPDDMKRLTNDRASEPLKAPPQVIIPMSMHTGAPCTPTVSVGDRVLYGQLIGTSDAMITAPIHSSVSGSVAAIEPRLHPNGAKVLSVVIDNDGRDRPDPSISDRANVDKLSPEEIVAIIKDRGITGMGGAAFPTHFKISSGLGKVDTLIINAAECEPYITSDHRTILEHTHELIEGVRLIAKAFGLTEAVIAVELNKTDAIEALRGALKSADSSIAIKVTPLKVRYPQGSEKQLIQAITGREVPPGGLPAAVGCAVVNTYTAYSVALAVCRGIPAVERIVTVSGSAVVNPKNLRVRVGTPVEALFEDCGGFRQTPKKILTGGPMMGVAQYDTGIPVIKATNAVLAFCEDEERSVANPTCIRCGKCVEVCPVKLHPLYLYMFEGKGMLEELERYNVADCMECGSCAYICPGRLPLVQSIRAAKQKIMNANNAKK